MRISKFVPAVLVAACITSLVAAQQARTPVTIVVTDPSGAAVPYAQVQVIPAPAPVPAPMATDEKGKLRLDLLPGKYALYVGGRTFIPTGADINVQPSNSGQTVTVTLQKAVGPIIDAYAPELGTLLLFPPANPEPVRLKLADLLALPHVSAAIHNSHTNADETYSGVRLSDLLAKCHAPLGGDLRGAALSMYLVAVGADGYKAVFSLAEVDPSFHPGEILVADTMNGSPLDAKTGPFRLVVSEDKRPARSVRNLVSIELKSAD